MAQAKSGDTVQVHYTGRLEDGSVFDSSRGHDPLQFTLGSGDVIPGFEQAVLGMAPGDTRTVTIPSDQAYGPRRDELVIEIGRENFPPEVTPEVGQRLQMVQDDQAMVVMVTGVEEDTVTLDANHPLAGADLTFDLELVGIEPA